MINLVLASIEQLEAAASWIAGEVECHRRIARVSDLMDCD